MYIFSEDQLSQLYMYTLLFILCQFAAFNYWKTFDEQFCQVALDNY